MVQASPARQPGPPFPDAGHTASWYARYRPYMGIIFAIVLFFLMCIPLYPQPGLEQNPFFLRVPLNIAFIALAGGGILWKPRWFFPVTVGLTPLFNMLATSMAIFGGGMDILFAVIAFSAWFRLKPSGDTRHVHLFGLLFIVGIIVEFIGWTVYEAEWMQMTIPPLRMITFAVMLYAIPKRLDADLARKTLVAITTGTALYGLWLLLGVNSQEVFITRLGLARHFNPSIVGWYMMLSLMSFVAFSRMMGHRIGLPGVMYFAIVLLVIFLSGSRMTYLMVLLFFIYLVLGTPYRRSILSAAVIALVVIVPLVQLFVGDVAGMTQRVVNQVSESQQFKRSQLERVRQNIRFSLNKLSWRLAADNPVFGVGPFNYQKYSYAEGLRPDKISGYNQGLVSHNSVAGMAAEYGYVGFTLLLLWNLSFLFSRFGRRRMPSFFLLAMVIINISGYLVGLYLTFFHSLLLLIGILYATWETMPAREPETAGNKTPRR